jgi:hypothetical protein
MPIIERTIKKMNPGYVGIDGKRIGLLSPPAGGTEFQMLLFRTCMRSEWITDEGSAGFLFHGTG